MILFLEFVDEEKTMLAVITERRLWRCDNPSYQQREFGKKLLGSKPELVNKIFYANIDSPVLELISRYFYDFHHDETIKPLHLINKALVEADLAGLMKKEKKLKRTPSNKYHST